MVRFHNWLSAISLNIISQPISWCPWGAPLVCLIPVTCGLSLCVMFFCQLCDNWYQLYYRNQQLACGLSLRIPDNPDPRSGGLLVDKRCPLRRWRVLFILPASHRSWWRWCVPPSSTIVVFIVVIVSCHRLAKPIRTIVVSFGSQAKNPYNYCEVVEHARHKWTRQSLTPFLQSLLWTRQCQYLLSRQ